MNVEKKNRKLEAKRIKEINSTIKSVPQKVQDDLGVCAVQQEDGVFFCGDGIYKKIYSIRPAILMNKKTELVKALASSFDNRIRLSTYVKNKGGKINVQMYMTVSFVADSYFGAANGIRDFESRLNNSIAYILNIGITPCSTDNVLSYVHMNFTGELKRADSQALFDRKNIQHGHSVEIPQCGYVKSCGKECAVFVGKIYPQTLGNMDITAIYSLREGTYHACVDFQRFNADEKEVYGYEVRNIYSNDRVKCDMDQYVNMTYLLTYVDDNCGTGIMEASDEIVQFFEEKKILLMSGSGRERQMFRSSCTLGLTDYHHMAVTPTEVLCSMIM